MATYTIPVQTNRPTHVTNAAAPIVHLAGQQRTRNWREPCAKECAAFMWRCGRRAHPHRCRSQVLRHGGNAACDKNGIGLKLTWPSAEWGSLLVEGGVAAAYRREIAAAADPKERERELEAELRELTSPFRAAEALGRSS